MHGNKCLSDKVRKLATDVAGVYLFLYFTTLVRCIRKRGPVWADPNFFLVEASLAVSEHPGVSEGLGRALSSGHSPAPLGFSSGLISLVALANGSLKPWFPL